MKRWLYVFVFLGFISLSRADDKADEYNIPFMRLVEKAEDGDHQAQFLVGWKYETGDRVGQRYDEAVKWYTLAADAGHSTAQNNLGSLYENGLGGLQNYEVAAELYRKSSEQGFVPALNSLARLYDLGHGVPQDRVKANALYLKAAEQGFPDAMFNLGLNYSEGVGIEKNPIEAVKWIDLARFFTQKSPDAETKQKIRYVLGELKKSIPKDQFKQGEKRSKEWYANFRKKTES